MNWIFIGIVIFLIVLAVFDLVVGVSNDAVNFLNSAIGAKVAKFRTILLIAAIGVFAGAAMSNGMMDVARHGIMTPEYFSFYDVMCVFLAVMVTDVVLLDVFNTLGMPTSTTVSMVFELLGGAFAIALLKIIHGDTMADGTFALAMAFAGNDLVNFVGVPLTGLEAYQDYAANGNGTPDGFMMTSLMESAHTPTVFLVVAGVVMVLSLIFSKKAQNVVKTSVDLSRQDEGDEMFGSSAVARTIVRTSSKMASGIVNIVPAPIGKWIDSRFNSDAMLLPEGAAFDQIRASVNLVLAGLLVALGTSLKLPLSTTYVTFMVAMGTSLADRAWSRESAVFRITGVLSVIGGWFITAGAAFIACYIVTNGLFFGSYIAMACAIVLAIFLLVRSNLKLLLSGKIAIFAHGY